MTALRLLWFPVVYAAVTAAALVAQDRPPAPGPPPAPPAVTAPAPAPAPADLPPVAPAARVPYEFKALEMTSRGALTALGNLGAEGWQLCQIDNFVQESPDGQGFVRQTQMVRLVLQRPVAAEPAP